MLEINVEFPAGKETVQQPQQEETVIRDRKRVPASEGI